jgi:glycosyltransferase involved in cell wall biosynthesis
LGVIREVAEADRRVRVYQTPENGGTYRAKNFGITKTDAELVTFMDSDDWAHPQRIERQVEILEGRPRIMAVCHSSLRIYPEGWIEFRKRALRLAYISTMMRRTVIDQLGYFDAVRVNGDAEMLARIRNVFGDDAVLHDPLPTLFMRRHPRSLTGGGAHFIGWRSLTGDRLRYSNAFKDWHRRCRATGVKPYVSISAEDRPFPVPTSLLMNK